jgi:hypothetical protein
MVSKVFSPPPLISVTEGTVAETFEAEPLVEVTVVMKETVPA